MYTELFTAAQTISSFPNNQPAKAKLINGVRTYRIAFRIRATLTLGAGPATAILNRGSVLAIFDRAGMDENGRRFWNGDARSMGILAQMQAPRAIDFNSVRLTSTANGVTNLEETLFLEFSSNLQIGPADVLYLERTVKQELNAFLTIKSNTNAAGLLVTTPGTAVLSNLSATVIQRYDTDRSERTGFLPVIETYEFPVTSTTANFPLEIKTNRYIRAMLFQQETTGVGEVSDIINSLALRADGRDIFGPDLLPYEDLQAM